MVLGSTKILEGIEARTGFGKGKNPCNCAGEKHRPCEGG